MFHVTPRLPMKPTERQQHPRKKLIGADNVLIIWCEHPLDYHPDTIVSGVTQIHIIVYPYKTSTRDGKPDLFRIEICKKLNSRYPLPDFGPLLDGMIVPRTLVAQLVRQVNFNVLIKKYTI